MRELPQDEGNDDRFTSLPATSGSNVPLQSLQVHQLLLEGVPGDSLEIPQSLLRSCGTGVSFIEPGGRHRSRGERQELGGEASEGGGESRGRRTPAGA